MLHLGVLWMVAFVLTGCTEKSSDRDGSNNSSAGFSAGGSLDSGPGDESTGGEDGLDDGLDDDGSEVSLSKIEIDPSEFIFEVDLGSVATHSYSALARYTDGSQVDVTNDVVWSIEKDEAGIATMNESTLTISEQAETNVFRFEISADFEGRRGRTQVTVAAYRRTGEETDFFFILPEEEEDGEKDGEFEEDRTQRKDLSFGTSVKSMDVFFAMDTTGSMGGAIANLKSTLSQTIIPSVRAELEDTFFGVGGYDDFPIGGYGSAATDQPFYLLQEVTDDDTLAQAGVDKLTTHSGADAPESYIEAAYQLATGEGLDSPPPTMVAPNNSGIGGVGFRENSMPVAVMITDAPSHAPGESDRCPGVGYDSPEIPEAHTRDEAHDALNAICARVVSIVSGFGAPCTAEIDGMDFAEVTGAMVPPSIWDIDGRPAGCESGQCCTGINGAAGLEPNADGLCHLVYRYNSNGTGVGTSVIAGLKMISRYAPFDVTTEVSGTNTDVDGLIELPEGKTTADFIKSVVPDSHGPVPVPDVPPPIINKERNRFERVYPGTEVFFKIEARNDFVAATEEPQVFKARISVLAGGCSELDDREVLILIPPKRLIVVD